MEGMATHVSMWHHQYDKKLEMPTYNRKENPTSSIFKVERYFMVNKLTKAEKLEEARVYLQGAVLAWLQWKENCRSYPTWEELKN